MFFNLIHKPLPENDRLCEAFLFQRQCARDLGIKVTNFIYSDYLEDPYVIKIAKEDYEKYGDEIALLLNPLPDMPKTQAWLLSREDKIRMVSYSVETFKKSFGFAPRAVSQYVLDSELIKIIKEYCPECIVGTAGCFEEGVKVYHGCNNSWYLFSEGMPWNPWYPSIDQSIRPAASKEEWAGMLALPHLNRDLVLSYEGRNDFFASHPANVQRALANDGYTHEYDYNLLDSFRMQELFNDGYSYYQINVSPGWLTNNFNLIDSDEVTRTLYREMLEYVKSLIDEGAVRDMTISEFAEWYMKNVPIGKTEVAVAKDILFDSGKHYFGLVNSDYRVLIDAFTGGAIGDLRPYVGKYASYTGPHSPSLTMNSYPYLIHSQYRTGLKHHCFDGARTTLFVTHNGETIDMAFSHTKVESVLREGDDVKLTLTPATLKFKDGLDLVIRTEYTFTAGGKILIERKILSASMPADDLVFEEYVKACYGFTEYPENMKDISLYIDEERVSDYSYSSKTYSSKESSGVSALIPNINTKITLSGEGRRPDEVTVEDGHLFSPYYVLRNVFKLKDEEGTRTWLTVLKA